MDYNPYYFHEFQPFIYENEHLREPQINAYLKTWEHFVEKKKTTHAIITLPTGVGKTGLMGLLPYGICNGRALIITPQLVIKDAVLDSLDPDYYDNFWLKRNVFKNVKDLPSLIEFEGKETNFEVLTQANIIVLNVHKLQKRLDSSLLNLVNPDFFDMIIIDEAHHSTAQTWLDAINYFNTAKVIKLTGTPFRTDQEKIVGEVIYKYKLSAAMANGYIKSLENLIYIPEQLYLTIDNDPRKYTVEEILALNLKDETWVSRSVAYSVECSEKVVNESIMKLRVKLRHSTIPHKIIAVACSIQHAEQIQNLYESKGLKCAIIHSKMDKESIDLELNAIENHRVQVVINVAMLGEGYDHPYLSIAAIFRPFRHKLPYAQFVGRILRVIPEDEVTSTDDNIGEIISHKHLGLEGFWEYYKKELHESDVIKYLESCDLPQDEPDNSSHSGQPQDRSIGTATESGIGKLVGDTYLDTELIKQRKVDIEQEHEKIAQLSQLLNISREDAQKIIENSSSNQSAIKRPDKVFKAKKKNLDQQIRYTIVPDLISRFQLETTGNELKNCRLFTNKYKWISQQISGNAGMLASYFNNALKGKLGKPRDQWSPSDYEIAFEQLDILLEYVIKVLEDYLNNDPSAV